MESLKLSNDVVFSGIRLRLSQVFSNVDKQDPYYIEKKAIAPLVYNLQLANYVELRALIAKYNISLKQEEWDTLYKEYKALAKFIKDPEVCNDLFHGRVEGNSNDGYLVAKLKELKDPSFNGGYPTLLAATKAIGNVICSSPLHEGTGAKIYPTLSYRVLRANGTNLPNEQVIYKVEDVNFISLNFWKRLIDTN